MNYDVFLEWLMKEKNLTKRGAKDVISRCKRICKILKIDTINSSTTISLNSNIEFTEKSMFIKSQLRRACTLWLEFENN